MCEMGYERGENAYMALLGVWMSENKAKESKSKRCFAIFRCVVVCALYLLRRDSCVLLLRSRVCF